MFSVYVYSLILLKCCEIYKKLRIHRWLDPVVLFHFPILLLSFSFALFSQEASHIATFIPVCLPYKTKRKRSQKSQSLKEENLLVFKWTVVVWKFLFMCIIPTVYCTLHYTTMYYSNYTKFYYTGQYYNLLYLTTHYCIVLHYATPYCSTLFFFILNYTAFYYTKLHYTILH